MDHGNGGARGLRAWARDAAGRADLLLPFHRVPPRAARGVVVDQAFFDRTLGELTELERLLDPDGQQRNAVAARLGVLLALRHANGGLAEDRDRALAHLRRVRAAVPQAPRWERQCAALGLLLLMAPPPQLGGGVGLSPDFPAAMNWYLTRIGRDGMAELPALLRDVEDLPMPAQLRAELLPLASVLPLLEELLGSGGVSGTMRQRLKDATPEGFPYEDQLRGLAHSMGLSIDPGTPPSPPPGAAGHGTPPRGAPPRAPTAGGSVRQAPGAVDVDAEVSTALLATAAAIGTGDPTLLDTAVRQTAEAMDRLAPEHPMALTLKVMRSALLHSASAIGGSHQDDDFAHRVTEEIKAGLADAAPASGPDADALTAMCVLSAISRIGRGERTENLGELDAVLDELLSLHATVPRDRASWILVPLALSLAHQARGSLLGDESEMLRGLAHLEECTQSAPPPWNEMLGELGRQAKLLRGHYENDPALVEESLHIGDRAAPVLSVRRQIEEQRTALSLMERYQHTDDPADLNRAIAGLERTRERARQGRETAFAADALWHLVTAYWLRWFRTQNPEELHAATNAGLDALHAVSADVLLQVGSEHGLQAARSAANHALMTTRTAIGCGRPEAAVTALELGRALVLHAASAATGVPELLAARGHRELADAWRKETATPHTEGGRILPGSLRRQALEALGYRQHDSRTTLFATPSTAALRAGVAAGDADVLVYLLPGQGEAHGLAIALWPDGGPETLDLPSLLATPNGPLAEYLNTAAARSRMGGEVQEQRWERALGRLCDWASYAVVEPLTEQLAHRIAARAGRGPLRLVLVPCGNLGVVPWHAARRRDRGEYRYACQDLVVTYAASGGQFLAAVGRERLPVDAAPVLVADPRMDLTHAEREISALHRAYYPEARLYGEFYEAPAPPHAPGTPDEVLAVLGEASLLHVASHGSAGPRPTVSALSLAFPGGSEAWRAERGGPGASPDLGMLTVTRLLDVPDDRTGGKAATAKTAAAPRRAGPLVVLSACETDLSTRDHDEALTLTTAFVARGARNVVGSRWRTYDGASALMMAVFHHFVAVEGQDPASALRSAQLWMLDPRRRVPAGVDSALARDAQLPGLERLSVWAAFAHQGHPGRPGPSSAAVAGEGAR
ncbi:CHAT domain-containing protein [Streptomyces sp. NPDC088170]|uniref:CHAT domain-containing protein n=1 Tax=Streptomyces sp. NPDC088170 TaxID=3365834 RepID=UPI00382C7AC1